MNRITKVEPPRSWNADARSVFLKLNYLAQLQIAKREKERDDALNRAQNKLADERKKLAETPTPRVTENENAVQTINA